MDTVGTELRMFPDLIPGMGLFPMLPLFATDLVSTGAVRLTVICLGVDGPTGFSSSRWTFSATVSRCIPSTDFEGPRAGTARGGWIEERRGPVVRVVVDVVVVVEPPRVVATP